jgi:hypothetical protein
LAGGAFPLAGWANIACCGGGGPSRCPGVGSLYSVVYGGNNILD